MALERSNRQLLEELREVAWGMDSRMEIQGILRHLPIINITGLPSVQLAEIRTRLREAGILPDHSS